MANFTAPLLNFPLTGSYKSAGVLIQSTRRAMLYEVEIGQTGSLSTTDCQVQWDLSRFGTTVGLAATALVPSALDSGDTVATAATYASNATAELTYTTAGNGLSLKNWGVNQRASYRWRALDDNDNLIVPGVALQGVGIRALSSSFTSSVVGNFSYVER